MAKNVKVKVINNTKHGLPEYQTTGAAGADVKANHTVSLKPGGRALIKTGMKVEIPEGYEIQVRPRSGLALNNGLTVLNSPGTIDSDYRGEIGVIIVNHSNKPQLVRSGERIGQLVLNRVEQISWDEIEEEVEELTETDRGEGGFGSTGATENTTENTEDTEENTEEVAEETA